MPRVRQAALQIDGPRRVRPPRTEEVRRARGGQLAAWVGLGLGLGLG